MYSLGLASNNNTNAYVIDDRYFSSVVRGQNGDNTIDVILVDDNGDDITATDAQQEVLFQQAISSLGVTSIRWPGGPVAERGLNQIIDAHNQNNGIIDWTSNDPTNSDLDVADLQAVIDYCADHDLNLSFTFPTEVFKGMTNAQIDAYMTGIKDFIREDLLQYALEHDVTIDSIKIGNEYVVNLMTPTEYGQTASRLTQIIGEEVEAFGETHSSWQQPNITIQSGPIWLDDFGTSGTFFGDHNGEVGGWHQDVYQIIGQFNSTEAGYVTAIDIHDLTLRVQSYDDYFGTLTGRSSLNTIYESLNSSTAWTGAFGNDVELHSLAWDFHEAWADPVLDPNRFDDGAALSGASMGFLQFYEMSLAGVSYASVYLASGQSGMQTLVRTDSELRAGGEVFRLMNDNLRGLRAVEFLAGPSVYENDVQYEDVVFRVFETDGQVVLYVGNLENELQDITMQQVNAFLRSVEGFPELDTLNDPANLHIWGDSFRGGRKRHKSKFRHQSGNPERW